MHVIEILFGEEIGGMKKKNEIKLIPSITYVIIIIVNEREVILNGLGYVFNSKRKI